MVMPWSHAALINKLIGYFVIRYILSVSVTCRLSCSVFGPPFGLPYPIGPLSVLSVMLVYCGQRVGWIKMKLDMPVGLRPGHIVLDGDPGPSPPKGHSPQFSAHVYCAQSAGWIKMSLGMEVGLCPGHMLDGDPAPPY